MTCGTRSRPRAVSRFAGSWTPGSSSRATRPSRSAGTATRSGSTPIGSRPRFPRYVDLASAVDRAAGPARSRARGARPGRGGRVDHPLAHPDAFVIVNSGSVAYVRTFYDDELRARLVDAPSRISRRASATASSRTVGRASWRRTTGRVVPRPRFGVRVRNGSSGLALHDHRSGAGAIGSSTESRVNASASSSATSSDQRWSDWGSTRATPTATSIVRSAVT